MIWLWLETDSFFSLSLKAAWACCEVLLTGSCSTVRIIETRNETPLTCARLGRHVARAWGEHRVARDWGGHHVARAGRGHYAIHALQ